MSRLPPYQFWSDEFRRLWDEMSRITLDIMAKGGTAGAEALPPEAQIFIDWDVFNQASIDYLSTYRLTEIYGIHETTQRQSINAISNWIRAGEPLATLEGRLSMIIGDNRARAIAVTEVTNIYSVSNQLSWKSSGVVGDKRWNTAQDELVCPLCGAYAGTTRPIDGGWMGIGGSPIDGPAAHPFCRCWLTPVVSIDMLNKEIDKILAGQYKAFVKPEQVEYLIRWKATREAFGDWIDDIKVRIVRD